MSNKDKKKEPTFTIDGKPFTVPPGGSLGLLALGSVGIRAWKKARKEYYEKEEDGKKEK